MKRHREIFYQNSKEQQPITEKIASATLTVWFHVDVPQNVSQKSVLLGIKEFFGMLFWNVEGNWGTECIRVII